MPKYLPKLSEHTKSKGLCKHPEAKPFTRRFERMKTPEATAVSFLSLSLSPGEQGKTERRSCKRANVTCAFIRVRYLLRVSLMRFTYSKLQCWYCVKEDSSPRHREGKVTLVCVLVSSFNVFLRVLQLGSSIYLFVSCFVYILTDL